MDHLVRTDPRYSHLRPLIAGLVLDSCPCYMHARVGARAIGEGRALPLRLLLALAFYAMVVITFLLSGNRTAAYWCACRPGACAGFLAPAVSRGQGGMPPRAPAPPCCPARRNMESQGLAPRELYLYSADDHLCDAAKLDALIAARRAAGRDVHAHKCALPCSWLRWRAQGGAAAREAVAAHARGLHPPAARPMLWPRLSHCPGGPSPSTWATTAATRASTAGCC